ncbi:MAG: hypothetical protein ACHP84_08300 [Caulobacterales bacterium]
MTKIRYALAATLAACLTAGVAAAQSAPTPASPPPSSPAAATSDQKLVVPSGQSNNTMQTITDTSVTTPTTPATTIDASATVATGTVQVISNPPVPDTAANRAKYGQPLSNAGRRTKAAGN